MRATPVRSTLVLVLALAPAALGAGVSDNFDRPNGTNMGPDWFEGYGDTGIENNQGKGLSGAFTKGWMSHTSFTGAYVDSVSTVDFQATGIAQAIVLLAGFDSNTWGGVSAKLQDNDGDGLLDRLFFEQAFNAGSWGAGSPVIHDLAVPTASGSLTLSFTNGGDTAVVEIGNDASGQTETASASGILSFAFPITGTEFGVGHVGPILFDDWSVDIDLASYGAGCPGTGGFVPVLSTPSTPAAGGPLTIVIEDGLGGATALLLFGTAKANLPIGGGGCALLIAPVLPPQVFLPLGGVGPGNGTVTLPGVLPASTSGFTFTMQAFVADVGTPDGFAAANGLR